MSFDQSYLLLGLLAVPILLAAYLWQTAAADAGRGAATRTSRWSAWRSARARRWRRHVPVALVLASLGLLGVAAARPQVKADVPISSSTVILALDVSGSMCATDVEPNRLAAAQAAVRKFVETQDDETKIGLVLFSGFAQLAVAPTTNKTDLLNDPRRRDDRSWHDHRRGDPQVDRRDRRARPQRGTELARGCAQPRRVVDPQVARER